MLIKCYPCPPISTNTYLVTCPRTKKAAVIDPGFHSFKALSPLLLQEDLHLSALLLTHSHWDHIAEVAVWQDRYDVLAYLHPLDFPNMREPGSDQLPMSAPIRGSSSIAPLEEGEQITVGEISFTIIYTPGHSIGSICFYDPSSLLLFSGDTLFRGSIGNLSFPTSAPKLMAESLKKLTALPPATRVYPGHGKRTTLGEEGDRLNLRYSPVEGDL